MNSRQTFLRLLTFVAPFWNRLLLAVVLGAATVGSSVALMGTSAYLISAAALRPSVADLAVAVVAVRTFGISRGLFRYLERLVSHDLSFRLLADLRVWFFARLEPLAPAGLQEERCGDLLSRAISDVDTLQNVFGRALAPPLVALTISSATALTLGLLLPALALPVGGIFLLAGVGVPGLAFLLGRINGRRLAVARGDLTADLVETLQGTAEIVAYGRQDDVLTRLARSDRELGRLSVGTAALNGFTESLSGFCAGLAVWLALLIAIPAVQAGVLPGVELGVVALLTLAAFEAIAPLPSAFHQLELSLQAARRLFAIADTESPVYDPLQPLPVPADTTVELVAARLRYGADEPWVLNELNLRLTPGRRVALVGPSGVGKTSLANVLVRFRDLDGGSARLGGHDVRGYRADDVRRIVGLAAQDAHLFNGSIRDNIRLARPDAPLQAIEAALCRARIWEWVQSLPSGLDTPVGEAGVQVSGGQRQRIAIARALLADFPVVIFDEPTANLDYQTADELMRDVIAATTGRSLLVITHQPIGLESMDEVLVLREGRITERGRPSELVSRGGYYGQLVASAALAPDYWLPTW